MDEAKLGFGGRRVSMGMAFEVVVRCNGDGVGLQRHDHFLIGCHPTPADRFSAPRSRRVGTFEATGEAGVNALGGV